MSKYEFLKKNWPKGSLEKTLNSMGVKSLTEAVAKRMNSKGHEMMPKEDPEYEDLKKVIADVTLLLEDFDIDKVNPIERRRLAQLPLTTLREALHWKEAWGKVIEKWK